MTSQSSPAPRWELRPASSNLSLPSDLPPLVAQILLRRGVNTADKLRFFLNPPQSLPYNPMRLAGMSAAVPRLWRAVQTGERVGIFGDFDVDGVTGTAIVAEGLQLLGGKVIPYLPHRLDEGHGLSDKAVDSLLEQGVSLIVTVDCGVTSVAEARRANQRGVEVIITDHHTPQPELPPAVAIVDPKLPGSLYPFGELCGAGLAFKLMQGLYQYCGQPWPRQLLELAALGTIADLVPLVDENRYIVQEGLAALSQTTRPGLLALYRRAGVQLGCVTAETVSFQIGPRLNASGRMGHALDSYRLLTTCDPAEAEALAERLEGLNLERRALTEQAYALARAQVEAESETPPILLVGERWVNPGVAGLVAGRLAEAYHRPAVVMAVDEEVAVASARSIPEFNLVQAFATCKELFVRYGGHSQAAGFTVRRELLPDLRGRLTAIADEALAQRDLRPALRIDAEIRLAELTPEALRWLAWLEPFGMGNEAPVFVGRRLQVQEVRQVGPQGQHLRLRLREGGQEWTALAFNQANLPETPYMDLAFSVMADRFRPDGFALKVADLRPAG